MNSYYLYPAKLIDIAIWFWVRAWDVWNYVLFKVEYPDILTFHSDFTWWHKGLLVLLYGAIYFAVAAFIWYIVGHPIRLILKHMYKHNCKMFPISFCVWTVLCYIDNSACIIEQIDGKNVYMYPPVVTIIGWIIYFIILLVKIKWRAIYFPILSLIGYCYVVFCIAYILVPIVIILAITAAISTAETYATDGVYTCRSCGRKYSSEGECPYCGGEVR